MVIIISCWSVAILSMFCRSLNFFPFFLFAFRDSLLFFLSSCTWSSFCFISQPVLLLKTSYVLLTCKYNFSWYLCVSLIRALVFLLFFKFLSLLILFLSSAFLKNFISASVVLFPIHLFHGPVVYTIYGNKWIINKVIIN